MTANCDIVKNALAETQDALYQMVYTMTGGSTDAFDLMQNTNVAVLSHSAEYDTAQPFLPWLKKFALNEVLRWRKDNARNRVTFDSSLIEQMADTLAARAEEEPDMTRRQSHHFLDRCLKKIPALHRAILSERFLENRKVVDMARERHVTEGSLAVLVFRIRKTLRECIEKARLAADRRASRNELKDADDNEFARLIERMFDNAATPEDVQRLGALLEGDSGLFSEYLDQASVNAQLETRKRFYFPRNGNRTETKPVYRVRLRVAALAAGLLALLCGGTALWKARECKTVLAPVATVSQPAAQKEQETFGTKPARRQPLQERWPEPPKSAPAVSPFPALPSVARSEKISPSSPAAPAPAQGMNRTEGENMNGKMKVVVAAAASLALSGAASGDTSAAVRMDFFPEGDNYYWSAVFTNQVMFTWEWPDGAKTAKLILTGMEGCTTNNLTLADSNALWTAAAAYGPDKDDVVDATMLFYSAEGTPMATNTARLALLGGAFAKGTPLLAVDASSKAWQKMKENKVVPFDAAWQNTATNAACTAFAVTNLTSQQAFTEKQPGTSGWFAWKKTALKVGDMEASLTFDIEDTAEYTARLYRPQEGTVIYLK